MFAVSSNIESSVFRLHVIANSDSKEDQDLKYIVRDNILTYINEISKNASTKEEVIEIARNNIDTIKQIAQETVYENGYNYSVNGHGAAAACPGYEALALCDEGP